MPRSNQSLEPALVRERIQRVGRTTDRLRLLTALLGGMLLSSAAGLAALFAVRALRLEELLGACLAGGLIGPLFCLPVAATYRGLWHFRIRRDLAALPGDRRAELLLSLRAEPLPDTRKLLAPHLRELRAPAEVIPSAPPPGRGREPSPAAGEDRVRG